MKPLSCIIPHPRYRYRYTRYLRDALYTSTRRQRDKGTIDTIDTIDTISTIILVLVRICLAQVEKRAF